MLATLFRKLLQFAKNGFPLFPFLPTRIYIYAQGQNALENFQDTRQSKTVKYIVR